MPRVHEIGDDVGSCSRESEGTVLIKRFFGARVAIAVFACALASPAQGGLPRGLLTVGYDGAAWYAFLVQADDGPWTKLEVAPNLVGLTWQRSKDRLIIKASDQRLYQYHLKSGVLDSMPSFDKRSYTQLRSHADGFVMVELVDGRSRNTKLIGVSGSHDAKVALNQDGAQFHPYARDKQMFYSHLSCRVECEPLIQEIWQKDLVTQKTKQLTLLNATSYLHSVDGEARYGFLSSNQRGNYHLARLEVATGKVVWLTEGRVTDSFPSYTTRKDLYFIRRTPAGTKIMRMSKRAALRGQSPKTVPLQEIALPHSVRKVRYLEFFN